jgi:hypothetical protein
MIAQVFELFCRGSSVGLQSGKQWLAPSARN